MGDEAALAVAPTETPIPAKTPVAPPGQRMTRQQMRESAMKRIQAEGGGAAIVEKSRAEDAAATAAPAATEAPKPAEPKIEAKSVESEKDDPATERALRKIEEAKKKLLDDQKAYKLELEVERAEALRLRKEAEGKLGSVDELKKLKPKDLIAHLSHLSDEDFDALSRLSYARTKAGQADPRAAAAAADAERSIASRTSDDRIAKLEKQLEDERKAWQDEFRRRDMMDYANKWIDEAVKSAPKDKPSLFGKALESDPKVAREEMIAIAREMEKANDGEQPTHAELFAEFEKRKRAMLKSYGINVDEYLAPPKAAPAKKSTTLDAGAPVQMTQKGEAKMTRQEMRANAMAKVRAAAKQTADNV